VVTAEDGRFALKAMMDERFDLIVLDLMMPWADGFDVLKNTGPHGPKIIVLTARDDDYTKRRATDLQVDAYLVKPYDPAVLSATVERLLAS
jgi:DNA-binding response OmpR family regulator